MRVMNLTAKDVGVSARDLRVVTNRNVVLPDYELNSHSRSHTSQGIRISSHLSEQPEVFEAWFSRCRQTLCLLACRVLGSPEQMHQVVESCKITASRNPPAFEYEGAFRSWLVRILIDEAIVILRQRKSAMTNVGT